MLKMCIRDRFLYLADRVFLVLPLGFQRVKLCPHLSQFLLDFGQMLLRQGVAFLFQGGFLNLMLDNLSLNHVQLGGHGVDFSADGSTGFIHQIDCLIRQETVGNIPVKMCIRDRAVSRASGSAQVELEENCSVGDVADALKEQGVINNSFFFTMYCLVTGADDGFGQGSFTLDTNLDYEAIINYLQTTGNRQDVVTITFPEGLSLLEVAQKLEENEV